MQLDPRCTLLSNTNPEWIKDLHIGLEQRKVLEEDIGRELLDMSLGNDCVDTTPKAQATQAKQ